MKNNKGYIVGTLIILLIIIISAGIFIWCISLGYRNGEETVCVVKDKWIKPSSKCSKYLVQCDNEVYEITDLFFKGKFNSSDIYIKLKKGHKYKIKTTGYRNRFFSMYKNINKVKELKEE